MGGWGRAGCGRDEERGRGRVSRAVAASDGRCVCGTGGCACALRAQTNLTRKAKNAASTLRCACDGAHQRFSPLRWTRCLTTHSNTATCPRCACCCTGVIHVIHVIKGAPFLLLLIASLALRCELHRHLLRRYNGTAGAQPTISACTCIISGYGLTRKAASPSAFKATSNDKRLSLYSLSPPPSTGTILQPTDPKVSTSLALATPLPPIS